MAARAGTVSLEESLKRALMAAQQGQQQAKPFDLQSTLQGADKAIQQGVFSAVDAIGGEGKRLIDGRFGFDALSQALPQLAQSGPQNLAEALATTRQGGAQWTNQDLQARRDRDNLGKAGGGAMDATWLLPAVPAAKGVGKIANTVKAMGGETDIAALKAAGYNIDEPAFRGDKRFITGFDKKAPPQYRRVNDKAAVFVTPDKEFADFFGSGSDPLARLLHKSHMVVTKGDEGLYNSYDPSHVARLMETLPPRPPVVGTDARSLTRWDDNASNIRSHSWMSKHRPEMQSRLKKAGFDGWYEFEDGVPNRAYFDPENVRMVNPKALEKFKGESAPEAPSPTTLSAGFGFGGKDGEKPLWDSLRDVFRGKQAPAPNPLDQFTPPTSLDDIFTGGPRSPRADTGPLDPRQPEGPTFNASTPEVGYDGNGFTGLDAQFTQAKNRNTLLEALAKREQKPLGYDDWSEEWRAAFDKGLPMDQASRMARAKEQGFDTNHKLYHGTDDEFSSFDIGRAGSGANAGLKENAIFLTDNPAVADSYLSGGYVKAENARGRSADLGDGTARWYGENSNVLPVMVKDGGNFDYWDWGGGGYSPGEMASVLAEAKKSGSSGAVLRGVRDPGIIDTIGPVGNPRKPSNLVAVFDPANIRSVNAAFDPANAGKPTLLGMGAPFEGKGKPAGYNDWAPEWRAAFDKGLPMDQASRMQRAREQGFDVDQRYFRSNLKDHEAYNPTGKFMGHKGLSGISVTDNPEMASRYLKRFGDSGWVDGKPNQAFEKNVAPVFIRAPVRAEYDAAIPPPKGFPMGSPLPENYSWPESLNGVDAAVFPDRITQRGDVAHWAPGDEELLKALSDEGVMEGTETILRDPANIRSVNAAFDPENIGKPNLLGMGRAAVDSDLIKLLMSYGAFGGMSAGALATLEAQKNAPALAGRGF